MATHSTSLITPSLLENSTTGLLPIHADIHRKLQYFIDIKKIPNIIFHGTYGCGKTHILDRFITSIYGGDKSSIKSYVMRVNCAHGKGIKFIREELKFFAKTNIDLKDGEIFKTIVLTNADKLTIDAQSALRRCIELFSHSTRFFIVVEDKYKLLKPILSRFCEIFVPEPEYNGQTINLHRYNIEHVFNIQQDERIRELEREVQVHPSLIDMSSDISDNVVTRDDLQNTIQKSISLYEKGYSAIDLINYIEQHPRINEVKKYELLITFNKVRHEFRNEKLLILFILNFILFRCDHTLENISFM
jgi:hypothetical protein